MAEEKNGAAATNATVTTFDMQHGGSNAPLFGIRHSVDADTMEQMFVHALILLLVFGGVKLFIIMFNRMINRK